MTIYRAKHPETVRARFFGGPADGKTERVGVDVCRMAYTVIDGDGKLRVGLYRPELKDQRKFHCIAEIELDCDELERTHKVDQ